MEDFKNCPECGDVAEPFGSDRRHDDWEGRAYAQTRHSCVCDRSSSSTTRG